LDDRGRLLSNPDGEDGVALSSRQLQIRSQIENYLETKAQRMVEQMVGVGNVSIQVAADLNFDQIDRTVQDVNPDLQTIVSEDRSEITPGEEDLEGASSVTSNTVFETAHSVETLSRGGARLERMTVAVVVNDRRSEGADGTVTFSARTQQEMQRVEALVRNAVGVSNDRGDAISVVSMPFEGMPEALPPEGIDIFALLQALQRPLIALSGLLVAFFLGTRVLASFKAIPVGPVTRVEDMRMPASDEPGKLPVPDAVPAKPVRQQYQIVDPQMTAKVIRAWMKEA
ncbi:MAG: hypothetical protein OEZ37_11200, partial [Gemmatimonadota bacterium]|nr:hypothetical protein [Gemmatimonadota bacterium]